MYPLFTFKNNFLSFIKEIKSNMKGIIYKWTCLETGKSYIGQTINEERREKEFFSKFEPYTNENSKIDNARNKYGLSKDMWNKEVLKRLWCKEGKEKDLLERLNYWEKYYIKEYDTFNNGYNSTNGGGHDFIMTEECKKKAGRAWLGKNRYASTCESIRQKRIGKNLSDKTKEKIRNTLLNYTSSIGKKIKQFDLNGNFIKEYSSISQIHRETGFKDKGIVRCANGLQEKSCGYIWKFSDEYVDKPKGCKGCYFYNRLGKYRARLRYKGKEYVLGFYRNEKAASEMYKLALENKDNIDIWFKDIEIHKRSIIEKYE